MGHDRALQHPMKVGVPTARLILNSKTQNTKNNCISCAFELRTRTAIRHSRRAESQMSNPGLPRLEQRLRSNITGDVFFDPFSRGRYATDASFYQIMPAGVVVPRTIDEALRALAIAHDEGRIVTPRGGGTSQCGQTVNDGIVVDFSKHLNRIVSLDVENRTCVVEPGIVLDDLNRQLKKHGLWFPVDVSTASRATIGGMAGNNSCGGRSLRYGTMRDNTISLDAALASGTRMHF